MTIPVAVSTSSVYPDDVRTTFALASDLGFDGVEVMVLSRQPCSRDAAELSELIQRYQLPVVAIHAPTLLVSQTVWGGPWEKIDRSMELATAVGADVVVLHPPFRWQVRYLSDFVAGVLQREAQSELKLAVENMFPWRFGGVFEIYRPDWDPTDDPYPSVTLDLSHAATSRSNGLEMARRLGSRLAHLHLADGDGRFMDEHLPPGAGNQPCAEVLQFLRHEIAYDGVVSLEINTRKYGAAQRDEVLADALAFARRHTS